MDKSRLHELVPFVAMVAPQTPKLSMVRVIEALVIAGITAAATTAMITIRLEERLQANQKHYDFRFETMQKSLDRYNDKIDDHLMLIKEREERHNGK